MNSNVVITAGVRCYFYFSCPIGLSKSSSPFLVKQGSHRVLSNDGNEYDKTLEKLQVFT